MLQRNISAPCTALDFPTRTHFVRELTTHDYDVVGLTGIIVNVGKIREMCRLVREHSPRSTIVVGGPVTAIPGVDTMIDADHIVQGEGVRRLRAFLGDDPEEPIAHPIIPSSFGFRLMGLPAPRGGGNAAATIIPSVGCPMGGTFCTTSAFFRGKGRFVNFLEHGADVYRAMCEAERIWLGLESTGNQFQKLKGTDTLALARDLQAHGIRVHGSTIIGMEHHTPHNIDAVIDHAVAHRAVFHQFMLYTPVPADRSDGRSLVAVERAARRPAGAGWTSP